MLKKLLTIVVIAGAAAASLGAFYTRHGKTAVSVSTANFSTGDVVQAVSATGSLEAMTTVDVGSQVSGTIASLAADFNSIVRAGQLLAEIDPSLLRAQTAQTRASVQSAEAGAERLRVALDDARTKAARTAQLNARQLTTTSDLDAARVEVRVAEAQLRSGEAQLVQVRASLRQCEVNEQHARIHSPIDGIVISRSVDVGQTVAASMQAPTLFTIAAGLSRLRLKAAVGEADVGLVREGQPVTFKVDAYPNETFAGVVTQIRLQATTTQNVVSYTTMIEVANETLKLRPGMTATATIEIARRDGVSRVPNTALRFRPTAAMFAALGQPQPAVAAARAGRPGAGPGARAGTPGGAARPAVVWAWAAGRLEPVMLATGISDGTYTEVAAKPSAAGSTWTPPSGGFDQWQLVTSLTLPASATASSSVASPLMQQNGPPPGMPPPGPPPGGPR